MRAPLALVLLALAPLSAGCREAGPRVAIETRRTASRASSPVLPGATPQQRFGAAGMERPMGQPEEGSDQLIGYDLPEGWRAIAPTADRFVNLRPAGDPEASCYLSFLPGNAGGLEPNINRWREQLGAAPLTAAEIEGLPTSPLFGREATLVEAEGTFTAMGSAPRAGFKLLGLAVSEPAGSMFLKFTGPAALVDAEREAFLAFAGSLHVTEEHSEGDGHDHGASAAGASAAPAAGPLVWKTPEGWREVPPSAMREASFALGEGGDAYVARLRGDGGGLRNNLDRWCDQLGRGPLSDEELAALEKIEMLDQEVLLLELEGPFTGMDGVERPDQALLGVALIGSEESLFVKLTGPAELVRAERASFIAFVGSLEERP